MSKQQKDKGKRWEDYLRYQQDGLSDEERHSIEREMEKDPFAAEAMEGISSVDAQDARKDLADLQRMIRKRTVGRSYRVWYAAAASVALLALVGTLYFTVFADRIEQMNRGIAESAKEAPAEKKELKEPESDAAQRSEPDETGPAQPAAQPPMDQAAVQDVQTTPMESGADADADEAVAGRSETVSEPETEETGRVEGPPTPEEMESGIEEAEQERVEGPPTPEEIQAGPEELAYEAAETMLEEEIAGGTGQGTEERTVTAPAAAKSAARSTTELSTVSMTEEDVSSRSPADRPAAPVGGMEAYQRYIRENLSFPETEMNMNSAEVRLSFFLTETGRPTDVQILESPSEAFSREAIRLLESGPDWEPARSSGVESRERISLTIQFER